MKFTAIIAAAAMSLTLATGASALPSAASIAPAKQNLAVQVNGSHFRGGFSGHRSYGHRNFSRGFGGHRGFGSRGFSRGYGHGGVGTFSFRTHRGFSNRGFSRGFSGHRGFNNRSFSRGHGGRGFGHGLGGRRH